MRKETRYGLLHINRERQTRAKTGWFGTVPNQSLEPGSSVRIVSDYGLDDRAIRVRSPAKARDFSCSHCVQPGSETLPASYSMGTGGLFHGGKARPGRDIDHSPPSSVEVVNE
jgi:hypothetical protein